MSNELAKKDGLLTSLANAAGLDRTVYMDTIMKTVMPSTNVKQEQVIAFLSVSKEYGLNPLIKEIYAFPGRNGAIIPMVSVDGWITLMNSHPAMDGVEAIENFDEEGELFSVTTTIWRKDRSHPVVTTEYWDECKRSTDPWRQYPRRMLRHKSIIQGARIAFGFSGIYDEDEAERIVETDYEIMDDDLAVAAEKTLEKVEQLKEKMKGEDGSAEGDSLPPAETGPSDPDLFTEETEGSK